MATRRGTLLLVAVWLVGALLATTVGVLAVRQVRVEVGDPGSQPLSASDVRRAVAGATPTRPGATPPATTRPPATQAPGGPVATRSAPTATHRPTSPPSPPAAAQSRTFQTEGGSVAVQCTGTRPSLVYVLPASGWSVDEQESHADRVEVRFRSDEREAEISVVCSASGTPVAAHD